MRDGKKSVSAVALTSRVILIDLLLKILTLKGVCEKAIFEENMPTFLDIKKRIII